MILQERISQFPAIKAPVKLRKGEKVQLSLTIPGQSMNLNHAMEQYKRGSLIERATAFYEKQGYEMPHFERMSTVERLGELAKFRKMKLESINKLKKIEKDVLEQKQKAATAKTDNASKPNSNREDGGDSKSK